MVASIEQRMEILFGLIGVIIATIFLLGAALFTPGYNPLENTVSSLGFGEAKSLFSISFVIAGTLNIPFYIYLERELVNIKESIRRLATGISIFTSVCIALVGIIPDDTYWKIFEIFHGFVAVVSFVGSSIYIVLYSVLMHKGPTSKLYSGPNFKKYLAYFGYFIGFVLITFAINGILYSFGINAISLPLIEWILTILISIWIFITAIQLISFKFFNIPGVYYKRTQFPEALKMFEQAIEILNRLNLKDEPITDTIKENIEFLKKKLEKEG
ncbi:MAG: DUF998 domain-containing protein [Promethearchaeota archaeon]